MERPDWFEPVQGPDLLQGDILLNCPVFSLSDDVPFPLTEGFLPTFYVDYFDLAIMTQSCDLANDKITEVLLAQVVEWSEAVRAAGNTNPVLKSREFRKSLVAGNVPSLSLLHKREAFPTLSWSVVDFRRLFTLPKSLVRRVAETSGPRLRLMSPYREHLAQAFARYFMRVGLPHDARSFEAEGKAEIQ